jgi:hypothetical protein
MQTLSCPDPLWLAYLLSIPVVRMPNNGWPCVESGALSTRQRRQSVVRTGITGRHRAIVLRSHDRKGLHACQAGSLDATCEQGRSPGSDKVGYVNFAGLDCAGLAAPRAQNQAYLLRQASPEAERSGWVQSSVLPGTTPSESVSSCHPSRRCRPHSCDDPSWRPAPRTIEPDFSDT